MTFLAIDQKQSMGSEIHSINRIEGLDFACAFSLHAFAYCDEFGSCRCQLGQGDSWRVFSTTLTQTDHLISSTALGFGCSAIISPSYRVEACRPGEETGARGAPKMMEFLKAIGALAAVFYGAAVVGCLGSDLCGPAGTEVWWATIGRIGVYCPIVSFVIVLCFVIVDAIASTWRRRRDEPLVQSSDDESPRHHRV